MSEITLEKVDVIRERTGVSYSEAKEALELCDGDVVEALIYIEGKKKSAPGNMYSTKEEFINWIKNLVKKGNVTRIKIRKNDKTIVDMPVNAGIAVTGIAALLSSYLLALGVITAVVTKVTIEITKDDGSVEVVNKIIKSTVDDVKDKFMDLKDDMKDKLSNKGKDDFTETNVYKYTVKFDDDKKETESDSAENKEE